jgi:hypothetical protein
MRPRWYRWVCLGAIASGCSVYDMSLSEPGATSGAGGASSAGPTTSATSSAATGATTAGPSGVGGNAADAGDESSGAGGAGGDMGSGDADGSGGGAGGAAADASDAKDAIDAPFVIDAPAEAGCSPAQCMLKAALVHRYSFDGTGTRVTDSVGTAHGTVMGAQLSGTGALVLAGGTTDQYVDLPNGIVSSLTNATFEAWITWNGGGGWQRLFDFGNSNRPEGMQGSASTTLYFTPQGAGPSVMIAGFKRADQTNTMELHMAASQGLPSGAMAHLVVVLDDAGNSITLYRNGNLEATAPWTDSLSALVDVNNWLGRSQYAVDDNFGGTLYEFRIYAAALSQSLVQTSYAAGTNPQFLE